jgi:anion-transporting  ArsA/GET3 family ATPase
MQGLLDRRLVIVTGKGGVGKTTIAGALGMAAARRGARTLVLDTTGASARLRSLFAGQELPRRLEQEPDEGGEAPVQLTEGLWSASIDPDRALLEWMQSLGGRVPARMLASRTSFQYFAAAAPGGRELICMVKVCDLAGLTGGRAGYDLVVLDAPATGHALAMLSSPQMFASIARVGPVATQAQRVQEILADPALTGYLAVAQASEMAVSETLDLQRELSEQLGVELMDVIVNATMHRRFTGEELERIASLRGQEQVSARSRLADAAAAAAQAAHTRTRFQHSQVARLRRHGLSVLQVPFVFQSDLDLPALEKIAERLGQVL